MKLIPIEIIENKILLLRGQKVMLDRDLAELYGVETKQFKRAVKRNIDRFPKDFMFTLTHKEFENLRCHFGTTSWGGTRHLPLAFTEQGVAMLSSVLNSKKAININIQIMRTFTHLREMFSSNLELKKRIEQLENKYDHQFKVVFDVIKKLLEPEAKPKTKMGFK